MSRVCLASFSDACMAWVHIKAMRYVEELLSDATGLVIKYRNSLFLFL